MSPIRLFLFALLLAGAAALAEDSATPAPASRHTRLTKMRDQADGALRAFEKSLAKPDAKPTVRDYTAAGCLMFALNQPQGEAETLFRHAFDVQQMKAGAPDFGDVPWQVGHAEIHDANSIEFTVKGLGAAFLFFQPKMSPSFLHDAGPHLSAALAAVRRHVVKPAYTNIFTMKIANLLMLGRALDDATATADGLAALDEWLAFTKANGIGEYDSPTYSAVQMECLMLAFAAAPDTAAQAKLRAALNYLWTDLAASYFPPKHDLSGPMSRTYDFLYHRGSTERGYYLEDITPTLENDNALDSFWAAAQFGGYTAPRSVRELAAAPERTVLSRFGPEPGHDRTEYITPDFAIGSSSASYGPQNVEISVEFASERKLPATWVVLDPFDAPYGKLKIPDRSGHSKPKVVKNIVAAVQKEGAILALFDQSPEEAAADSLGTNVILPVESDGCFLDGAPLKLPGGNAPFSFPLTPNSTLCVREGSAMVAVHIFAADDLHGQPAPITFKYDGNEWGAARLVAMHKAAPIGGANSPAASVQSAGAPIRAGLFLEAAHCADPAAVGKFLERTKSAVVRQSSKDGVWTASVKLGGADLEAALDLKNHRIAHRRIDGAELEPKRLTVNGRDLAAEILDSPLAKLPHDTP